MDFTTIILRFRDLVTESGKTIEEHKEIIYEKNFVWWAWWNKGNEKTPVAALSEFNELSKEQPQKIYLIDSGNNKLYYAMCSEIIYNSIKTMDSPEKKATPPYYCDNKYHVWFKFTKIEECENDTIKNYSYVDVKTLFEKGEDDYSLFNNKMVFDTNELIQQNRTLWFIRDFAEGDKENEIRLLNSNYVEPSNFSKKTNELSGNTFLWLSDLHLSNGVLNVSSGEKSLSSSIKQVTSTEDVNIFSDISTLIISGDITDCCKEEGFEQAKLFISNLNRELGGVLDNQRILICPGNHDLKRIEDKPPQDENGNFCEPDYFWNHKETAEYYCSFYKDIFKTAPNKHLSNGRKFLTKTGRVVEIAAINTMVLQQYKGFEGHGFISQEQLDEIESEMNWGMPSSSIRIVVMHHHYCPACLYEQMTYDKAGSVVYDANRLIKWALKNNVKMILHGHKHNEFFTKVSVPIDSDNEIDVNKMHNIYVVSLGGTGAKGAENKYGTITFERDRLVFRIYKFYPDQITADKLEKTILIPYGELQ